MSDLEKTLFSYSLHNYRYLKIDQIGRKMQTILDLTNKEKSDDFKKRVLFKSNYDGATLLVSTKSVKSTRSWKAFKFEPNWVYMGIERTIFAKLKIRLESQDSDWNKKPDKK